MNWKAQDSRFLSQGFRERLQVRTVPLFLALLKSLSSHLCPFIGVNFVWQMHFYLWGLEPAFLTSIVFPSG